MFPAKSSRTRGSQPRSSSRLADFSDGLEFLLAGVPLAWKCLRSPQISSPTPSRAPAHIWDGKGEMIPSGDAKASEKFHGGHSLSPHGPGLRAVPCLGALHLDPVPSTEARPEGRGPPHTLTPNEGVSGRACAPPKPDETEEMRKEKIELQCLVC